MGASSKKRGQQRKAAKKALLSSSDGVVGGGDKDSKNAAKIRRGDNKATKKLVTEDIPSSSFGQSGILSTAIDFLNRCEDETFDQVLRSVGGDLKSPSLWIHILSRGSLNERSSKLQIAENIGPLVSCMINDTERTFFKSNNHWRQGIEVFVYLLSNVTQRQNTLGQEIQIENMNIIETLLQHDGLLRFVIQMAFWGEHRPDIVKELKSGGFVDGIVKTSGEMMEMLIVGGKDMEEESRIRLLEAIGSTSIINKEYDPKCLTSYTAGLVHLVKRTKAERERVFHMIQRLVRDADCVDKGVIEQVIDLGFSHLLMYGDALRVGGLSLEMIHQGLNISNYISDTRTAFAIRTGLIEMCSDFIKRFKEYDSCGDSVASMHVVLECVFQSLSNVILHKKTAKAIRSKRSTIEAMLLNLEHVTNNSEYKKLSDMLKSILYLTGSYCCRCNKSLSKTGVKLCNGCNSMTYCSRACQKEDWLNGHNVTCCISSPTIYNAGLFQGRYIPADVPSDERAAAKLKEVEINMNMIQLKLLLDLSETILAQAKGLDIPLCDCVVIFDLRHCPLTVEIEKYTTALESEDDIEGYEESRSKDKIMCVYHSNIYIRGAEEELAMQRFFPHEWLEKQSIRH